MVTSIAIQLAVQDEYRASFLIGAKDWEEVCATKHKTIVVSRACKTIGTVIENLTDIKVPDIWNIPGLSNATSYWAISQDDLSEKEFLLFIYRLFIDFNLRLK